MGVFRGVIVTGIMGACSLVAWVRYGGGRRTVYGRLLEEESTERKKWDSNWDQMAPKPVGEGETSPPKPTASRHLIMVRHGQYEMNHSESDKKVLTEIGRQQALATGKRLKELNKPYTIVLHSTLIRAVQTAKLIHESLPDVPIKSTDLLKEGAPILPEPSSKHWTPPEWVRKGLRIHKIGQGIRGNIDQLNSNISGFHTEILVGGEQSKARVLGLCLSRMLKVMILTFENY